VFTFRLLDFTQKLQTRAKTNLYDFHSTLVSFTRSAGLNSTVVCLLFYMIHVLFWHDYSPLDSLDTVN
jgi:hypothetical protein